MITYKQRRNKREPFKITENFIKLSMIIMVGTVCCATQNILPMLALTLIY